MDSSALTRLVLDEPESDALRAFVADADLVTCELALTEVPRAIHRAARGAPRLVAELIGRTADLLEGVGLAPLWRESLIGAGALQEPALRALDAIHIRSALGLAPIDAFVTYDERQAAAARIAGLRTVMPGA
jgi:predicted nucleic acid-binding protein